MSLAICFRSPRKSSSCIRCGKKPCTNQRARGKSEGELQRTASTYKPLHSFSLNKEKPYQQQFADMYFLRLTKIKPVVERIASEAWSDTMIAEARAEQVERVLDIRQGELCWVVGTVYMDMSLKPNILEDVSKDVCEAQLLDLAM